MASSFFHSLWSVGFAALRSRGNPIFLLLPPFFFLPLSFFFFLSFPETIKQFVKDVATHKARNFSFSLFPPLPLFLLLFFFRCTFTWFKALLALQETFSLFDWEYGLLLSFFSFPSSSFFFFLFPPSPQVIETKNCS